jgi:hypothetical protein
MIGLDHLRQLYSCMFTASLKMEVEHPRLKDGPVFREMKPPVQLSR